VSKPSEIKELPDIVKIIKDEIGRLLGTRITVAIVNAEGNISYIDNEIKKFSDFIISFTKGNFSLLAAGDHSLPLSGTNIAFFKISEKALIILNSDKGPVGQLLAFKGRMQKYADKIDTLLEAAIVEEETKASAKAAVRVPVLTVSISNKKFAMEEAKVLHLVNGENTVSEICEKTGIPQLKVDEILRKYQKKAWIKLKRLIIGVGREEEPEVEATPPPTGAIAAQTKSASPSRAAPSLETEAQPRIPYKIGAKIPAVPSPSKSIPSPELSQIPKPIPEMPSYPPPKSPPPSPPESEGAVLDELMQLIETAKPVEESPPAEEMPQRVTPKGPPTPPVQSTPKVTTSVKKTPQKVAPAGPPTPQIQPSPKIAPSTENIGMTEIKGEPVSDSLFDELSSLLDKAKPMSSSQSPSSITPEPEPTFSPSPPPMPVTPIEETPADEGGKVTISGDSLLQETETEEGIKITVYPEEDPLKSRLQRLSNILEETTTDISQRAEKEGVEIQGSKAVCPNCRALVIIMSKVCPNCQRPLRTCPNCNAAITLFARICPACGSLL
jgi:RNA polymerase subunit RPABC4/transcription elongation factor Spt4